LTVLPIGKWIIPAGIAFLVFLLFALLFDSKKRKKFKLFNKIIMSSTLSRTVLKGIIAGTVTMGIPMLF
jgi:hypothetical protein